MQNQKEIAKINHFLSLVLPIVVDVARTILQSFDWQVKEEGHGLDLAFSIKSGEKEIKFFMYNLLMEIATIDRDEDPPRFDENLRDFDFFLAKTVRLTQSKLQVLFQLLKEENVDVAIENITQDAKQYERIRIWRFDQKKPTLKHHR
jgi:hypothetical protein